MAKKKDASAPTPRALTPVEREWMPSWSELPFLELDIHAELEHQMRLCMRGAESALVIGEPGAGKTRALAHYAAELEMEELDGDGAGSTGEPREICRYTASQATGKKTALLDLWRVVNRESITAGMQRRLSPRDLQHEIVKTLQLENVTLICIDEAQMIDAQNLDLLRQIPDLARENGHPLGMIVAGTAKLRNSLVEIGQMGQRFSAEIRLQPLNEGQFRDHWSDFHTHLGELRGSLPRSEWNDLTEQVCRKTRGNLRRLQNILVNANALALVFGRPIDQEILNLATDKLADEE